MKKDNDLTQIQLLQNLFSKFTLVDLTHPLDSQVPSWDGSCGFQMISRGKYADNPKETNFILDSLNIQSGIGTHMDAPCHCVKGGMEISDIPIRQFFLPLIVLNVSEKAHADYLIDVDDIIQFEENYGRIPSDCLVIGYTGWSKHWNNPKQYRNADQNGQLHFPVFSAQAAEVLLNRGVTGIGIDTLSPDLGIDGKYPVHELILGNGKFIVENIANAHLLSPIGAFGVLLPLKVLGGAEAPVRFVGLVG